MILAALALWLCSPGRADTVYLTNGNHLEGAIVKENSSEVTLDIGYGSTTIERSDILRIKRADKASEARTARRLERRRYEAGLTVPPGAEKLDGLYRQVQSLREKALDAKTQENDLDQEAASIGAELPQLKSDYGVYSSRLQGLDPSADPRGYNARIAAVNAAGTHIQADELRLQEIARLKDEGQKQIHSCLEKYHALEEYLAGPGAALLARKDDYDDWLRGELRAMARDFRQETVATEKRGGSLLVDVLINGKVHARLLVDTGASTTVLYKEAADRLALAPEAIVGESRATVADGRTLEGRLARLDSMAVGKSEVKGSSASLVPVSGQGFDGLLGMSFLGHFIARVDAAQGRLLLESLEAP